MKGKNDDLILAALAASPTFGILAFLICYNLPSWG